MVAHEPLGRTNPSAASAAMAYDLVLFVSAGSSSSARAIRQVQALCEKRLPTRYSLAVVDVSREPELVPGRVLATPTLLRRSPGPERLVVGDFSDEVRVMTALEIDEATVDPHLDRPVDSAEASDG